MKYFSPETSRAIKDGYLVANTLGTIYWKYVTRREAPRGQKIKYAFYWLILKINRLI